MVRKASAYRIIEDTLNLRDTRIFDYVYDEHSNKKAVFNAKETTAAQAKQEASSRRFRIGYGKTQNGETALFAITMTPLTVSVPVSTTAAISLSAVSARNYN